MKHVIEEKVVGPSEEELRAARDEGKMAMQTRNAKIEAAQKARSTIDPFLYSALLIPSNTIRDALLTINHSDFD